MWLTAAVWASALVGTAPADEIVHPATWAALEVGPAKVWVFFTDKGIESELEYRRATMTLARHYDPRALRRRAARRTAPGLFDERDLPVVPSYVEAVASRVERVVVVSRWLNAVSVVADAPAVRTVAALPFVRGIQPVRRGRTVEPVPVRHRKRAPGGVAGDFYGIARDQLEQIGITQMHAAGFTGSGMVIGVLDTGFKRTHEAYTHPDHPIDVVAEWDFVDDDANAGFDPDDPCIDTGHIVFCQHSHGTIVLGVIAAYMPLEMVGGAYDASFILAKTEDIADERPVEEDYYVAGLEFIEANGGDLATSSLGYWAWYDWSDMDGMTAVTTIGVNTATENGLVCCTAVGNGGQDQDLPTLIAPSDAFDVISCGSVYPDGSLSGFSSIGPTYDGRIKPEVLARGEQTASVSDTADDEYLAADGTSMSTPLVASAVALLLEAHPNWSVPQVRRALFETADYYVANGEPDPASWRGYGVIDVYAASQFVFADMNCDGALDSFDIEPFIAAVFDPDGYAQDYPACDITEADLNGDGAVDAFDIEPFLRLLFE